VKLALRIGALILQPQIVDQNLSVPCREVRAVLCKGCGACAVTCPSKAIRLQHFTPDQILAQVEALVGW